MKQEGTRFSSPLLSCDQPLMSDQRTTNPLGLYALSDTKRLVCSTECYKPKETESREMKKRPVKIMFISSDKLAEPTEIQEIVKLQFQKAFKEGSIENLENAIKTANMNYFNLKIKPVNSSKLETGLMYALSNFQTLEGEIIKKSDYWKRHQHFYRFAKHVLNNHKDKLDLSYCNAKGSIMEKLLNPSHYIPLNERNELIKLILKQTSPAEEGTDYQIDQENGENGTLLKQCCKEYNIALKTINIVLEEQPNLMLQYKGPVPMGSILHQIIFWYSNLMCSNSTMNEKKAHGEQVKLTSKLKAILKHISTVDPLNVTNEANQTALEYAESKKEACKALCELLTKKQEALQPASQSHLKNPQDESSKAQPVSSWATRKRMRFSNQATLIGFDADSIKKSKLTVKELKKQDRVIEPVERDSNPTEFDVLFCNESRIITQSTDEDENSLMESVAQAQDPHDDSPTNTSLADPDCAPEQAFNQESNIAQDAHSCLLEAEAFRAMLLGGVPAELVGIPEEDVEFMD